MALDEQKRTELAQSLEDQLGSRTAELMMEAVSAADLSNLATKQDLQGLATKQDLQAFATKHELLALDHKVDLVEQRLTAEIHRVGRTQLLGFASIVALLNTALAAFSFLQP